MTALGRLCCTQAFFSCSEQGLLSSCGGLLIAVASPVAGLKLWGRPGSVVETLGL